MLGNLAGKVVIKTLGKGCSFLDETINDVWLLGYDGKLAWAQTEASLVISIPENAPQSGIANVFRITGCSNLKWDGAIYPNRIGDITLTASSAHRHGDSMALAAGEKGEPSIRSWVRSQEYVSWRINARRPGSYRE